MKASDYVNHERRDYSLYVLQQRAIPHAADGLKASSRRVLWTGRDGKTYKSATLAGATMPIHPHQAPESAVNTLAATYSNNIPLLKGDGAFGTLLDPNSYGASRYTSVKVSEFTKDVVFRDIEIIPMQENYDGTLEEPKHFLPLIPIGLLNPQEGIAIGFATNILPRSLHNIIKSQLDVLEDKRNFTEELPELTTIGQQAISWNQAPSGRYRYIFEGEYEKTGATTLKITNLPYGVSHEDYIKVLIKLEEEGTVIEYVDNSRDRYNIDIKFKRGILAKSDDDGIKTLLELRNQVTENMTIIDFDGERVWVTSYQEFITKFCQWRLEWYVNRYRRLADLLEVAIARHEDILLAIRRNVGGIARKIRSKAELKDFLKEIGIVHIDYISELPVYRFIEEERLKVEEALKKERATLTEYRALLKSKDKRRIMYVTELKEILTKYRKGNYG